MIFFVSRSLLDCANSGQTCSDTGRCYLNEGVCNGVNECANQEDENNCSKCNVKMFLMLLNLQLTKGGVSEALTDPSNYLLLNSLRTGTRRKNEPFPQEYVKPSIVLLHHEDVFVHLCSKKSNQNVIPANVYI